jgi:hypothetical protein
MKKIILGTILLFSIIGIAQEKIGNKLYLYGDLENSVKGKTLILYRIDDPKGEVQAIENFKEEGIEAVSWHKYFIPGQNYSNSEINKIISDKNVETIITIKINSTSSYTHTSSNTIYSSFTNSLNTSGSSSNIISNVGLVFEIYSKDSGFGKPVAVINGNAGSIWAGGVAGSPRVITLKIIDRVISSMKKEKAFK